MSSDNDQKIEYKRPVKKTYTELDLPPNVNDIEDLIKMAQTGKKYANINNEMLWKISAQLIEINEMIGMKSLKESIFYHVIYYLQNLYIDDEKDYLHTVIMGPPGTGKCLAKDTLIMMYDGTLKKVQDIRVGDLLMGDDSTHRLVETTCIGTEEMFQIQSLSSDLSEDTYIVNKSHILSLKNIYTDETLDISVTDYLKNPILYSGYKTTVRFNNYISCSIDPFILGYSIMNYDIRNGSVYIKITDPNIQEYFSCSPYIERVRSTEYKFVEGDFKECFNGDYGILPIHYRKFKPYVLAEILGGIHDAYAEIEIYEQNDHDIDEKDEKRSKSVMRFSNEQYEQIICIKTICDILGLRYDCRKKTVDYTIYPSAYQLRELHRKKVYYTLYIYDILTVIPSVKYHTGYHRELFKQTFQTKFKEPKHTLYPIRVNPIGIGTYYGFEINGNRRFVLGNHIVTHNTTIAKIIGEMYKNMGILSPDGIFKIAKREDFVAEYLGQTVIKTKKLLESCIGGVLFIDEVYALGPGKKDQDSFSKEAIDTINVFLSENSDSFCCIIAGYEDDIRNCFFSVNQGLERRFQWVHRIEPYSSEELASMFIKILNDIRWKKDESVTIDSLTQLIEKHKQLFTSYGGDIENLITKSKMAHAKRIINLKDQKKHILTLDDINFAISLMKPNSLHSTHTDDQSFLRMYM